MNPIHIAPAEPVAGKGTAESPYRSDNIDRWLLRDQPIILKAGETYTTQGCAHVYYNHVQIEGNGAELMLKRPDWGTRPDVGIIRTNSAFISDLNLSVDTDPAPGQYAKEGIFATHHGDLRNVTVRGLNSNVEAGMESFGILLHGGGIVQDCSVYGGAKNDPYSVGIYAGGTTNNSRVYVLRCNTYNTRIAFGGNHMATFRDCYGINNTYAFYTDTDSVLDWAAAECEFDDLKYAAFSVIDQRAANIKLRECTFNFASSAKEAIFVALTGQCERAQFYRNTAVSASPLTLVSATKLPLGLTLEDNLLLASTIKHNIRAGKDQLASPQHLNTLLLRGNRSYANTLVTAASITTEGATEK